MSRSQVIMRGMVWLLVGQLWSWSLRLLETAIVPKILRDTGYGMVSYAATLLSLVSLVVVFGGSEHVIRTLVADPEKGTRLATALMIARGVLLLPLLSLVYVLCRFVAHTDPAVLTLMTIFMVNVYLMQMLDIITAWRQGYSQFGVVGRTQMIAQSVGLPAGILLVMAGYGTRGAAWGVVITSVVSLAATWMQPQNPIRFVRVSRADFVMMFREGLPFARYGLFLWLYGEATSVLFIQWFSGHGRYEETGWYTLAIKLVGVLFFVPAVIVQAMMPTLTDAYERAREEYNVLAPRFVNLILTLSIPFALLLIVRADALLTVLHYPKSFHHATILMQIVGFGLWMRWASVCYGALLVVTNRANKRANAATLAAPYNLLATPILVYLCHRQFGNGGIGALIAAETTELLVVSIYLRNFRDTDLFRQSLRVTGRGLLAGIVPFLVLQLPMPTLPLFLLVGGLAIGLYLPAAVLTGALPRADLGLLGKALKSKTRR